MELPFYNKASKIFLTACKLPKSETLSRVALLVGTCKKWGSMNTGKTYANSIRNLHRFWYHNFTLGDIVKGIKRLHETEPSTMDIFEMLLENLDNARYETESGLMRPAGDCYKRGILEAFLFVVDIVSHMFEDVNEMLIQSTSKAWLLFMERILDAKSVYEMRIINNSVTSKVEVWSIDAIQDKVRSTFLPSTRAFCVLMIHLHTPLRDDAQFDFLTDPRGVYMHGEWQLPPGNYLLIEERFRPDEPPKGVFTMFIRKSKTIGEGKIHPGYSVPLTEEITHAIWAYHKAISPGGWNRNLFQQKNSQYIITWMREMGITITKESPTGEIIKKGGAGVNYLRKAHRAYAMETGDAEIMAATARKSGHSALTATRYNATIENKKRKLEEAQETDEKVN